MNILEDVGRSMRRPPELDPGFAPAILWIRAYRKLVSPGAEPLGICLLRGDGTVFRHETAISRRPAHEAVTLRHVERLVKFLLWQKGGSRLLVSDAGLAAALGRVYGSEGGARTFDRDFIGRRIFDAPLSVEHVPYAELPAARERAAPSGRHLDGCRIGFDLGGSDRKAAALVDGKVVFSEEIPWNPYFETDPDYHLRGIDDSLRRAAAHLPRVDAIGGSAAGVYVDNEVRAGSLYRGVPENLFETRVRRMFKELGTAWGVPLAVMNDGEVTALAGAMELSDDAVLGVSMGTSMAAGYVTPGGALTSWLNELAFAPVDYRVDAPRDEWSGDIGCGAQYFSQQGVARLAAAAGIPLPADLPLPERLVEVQRLTEAGDDRAAAVFRTLGACLGYALAHYREFYDFRNLLLLGRVTSGAGGDLIMREARAVLEEEFPEYADIRLHMPGGMARRHGQAVAAASLPETVKPTGEVK